VSLRSFYKSTKRLEVSQIAQACIAFFAKNRKLKN